VSKELGLGCRARLRFASRLGVFKALQALHSFKCSIDTTNTLRNGVPDWTQNCFFARYLEIEDSRLVGRYPACQPESAPRPTHLGLPKL